MTKNRVTYRDTNPVRIDMDEIALVETMATKRMWMYGEKRDQVDYWFHIVLKSGFEIGIHRQQDESAAEFWAKGI